MALNDGERNSIIRMFGPNCSVKCSAIVRLYVTPPNGIVWKFTGIIGALTLMNDNNIKGHFLRIVDIKNMKIIFEQEIYEFFEYKNPRAWFHTFESDNVVHGFSFANDHEAKALFDALQLVVSAINGGKIPASHPHRSSAQLTSQSSLSSMPTVTSSGPEKEKKKKKKLFGKKKKEEPQEHIMEISGPTSFKHESHIGWDAQKGFEIRNIPPEWKKLFQQAGIRKSELRDKETASMLMNIVGASLGAAAPPIPSSFAPPPPQAGPPVNYPSTAPPPPPFNPPYNPPSPMGGPMMRSRSETGNISDRAPPPPIPSGPSMTRLPPAPPPMMSHSPGPAPPPPPPPPMMSHSPGPAPPPPPPMMSKSFSSPNLREASSSSSSSSSAGDGRSDLLSAIRGGTQLRKVDAAALPDISALPESDSKSIVDTLALAIQARRQNIHVEDEDEEEEEDDWEEDDEWSD